MNRAHLRGKWTGRYRSNPLPSRDYDNQGLKSRVMYSLSDSEWHSAMMRCRNRAYPHTVDGAQLKTAKVERQAGGVVFRAGGEHGAEVLIVTSLRNPNRWVLPKGRVRRLEQAEQAALREVCEEAGVIGRVIAPCGVVEIKRENSLVRLEYFLVEYLTDTKVREKRDIRWYPVEDAIHRLSFASARKTLLDAHPEIVRLTRRY